VTGEERRARFQRALDYGGNTHEIADVARMVREGRAQWWPQNNPDSDGMIVTELLTFPNMRAVNYWLIAGSLPECLGLDAEITAWAIEQGCTVGMATGRRGWGRAGAPYGWRPHSYTFVKDLLA